MDRIDREISPLDGRYRAKVGRLGQYFSEFALARARCRIEIQYLFALTESGPFPALSAEERENANYLMRTFGEEDFQAIKRIEEGTRHDVKACEVFLRQRLALSHPWLLHFGLTSEDVNNLAYSTLLDAYRQEEQLPALRELLLTLAGRAHSWQDKPFPARTHGQLASPTTAGKEVAVFLARLLPLYRSLRSLVFQGKLNGATGNYSAMVAALPHFDWVALEERFVRSLGLEPDLATTQIEPHDRWITYFDLTRHINAVLLGLDLDFWLYISYGYFRQVATSGQVGSSTMPHKVNPIRFENSEGNLELSNAILGRLAEKLGRSRMQRDLSDTTLERNIGVALAHAQLAWSESTAAVKALELDETATRSELEAHPELLAEAIQTILRTIGWDDPYELLRRATQGHPLTTAELQTFLAGLGLPPKVAERCRALRPAEYVGLAPEICRRVLAEADRELSTS